MFNAACLNCRGKIAGYRVARAFERKQCRSQLAADMTYAIIRIAIAIAVPFEVLIVIAFADFTGHFILKSAVGLAALAISFSKFTDVRLRAATGAD